MRVIRANKAGACYGVQRALDMAMEVIEGGGKAYTLGPLIHNPAVVRTLSEKGACAVGDVDELGSEGTVIIRSHGVTPAVLKAVEEKGLDVVDATCPHVLRAQKAAADLGADGCHVIVVGEAGHPEVEAICAWAEQEGAPVTVVLDPDELPSDPGEKVGVVVQTTQTAENLQAVVDGLESLGIHPRVKNTICSATQLRQEAAAELARSVDAMVVIGGRNSSNTTRLTEICSRFCPATYHIEDASELDLDAFEGCETVGVSAGASTPEDQIQAVEERLERR